VGVAVGEDHLLVGVVAEDDLVEDAQAELGELDAQRPIFSISTRCSSVMPWVMPPGTAVAGWILRPPIISMTLWPFLRPG
jgi:hypothetical protein